MTFQIVLYRQYAFEATWLYLREATRISTLVDQRKHGAICNSIARYNCSIRIFRQLQNKLPNDIEILSNLALALTFSNKTAEAFPYFKAYFSGGGKAFDVMYWYAKALKISGQPHEAVTWLYNVVYYNPSDIEAARELVTTLAILNRPVEALSFMASLMDQNRDDASNELWLTELKTFERSAKHERKIASAQDRTVFDENRSDRGEFKIPALDGRQFFIPFRTLQGDYRFIVADEREIDFVINKDDLKSIGWNYKKISANAVIVDRAQIGMLSAERFEARICDSCVSKIGIKFLTAIDAHVDGRGKIPYLVLQKGEM